jgi:hypothetical protein
MMGESGKQKAESGNNFIPSLSVYRALVTLGALDLKTREGVDEFIDAVCVIFPDLTRAQIENLDMGVLGNLVHERVLAVAPLFERSAEVMTAIAQAQNLVEGGTNE